MPTDRNVIASAVDSAEAHRSRTYEAHRDLIEFFAIEEKLSSDEMEVAAWRCHELQLHDDSVSFWKSAIALAKDQYSRESCLEDMVDALGSIDYDAFPTAFEGLLWALREREQHIVLAQLLWNTTAPTRQYLLAAREALNHCNGTLHPPLPSGDEFGGEIHSWTTFADACLFHGEFDIGFHAIAIALQHGSSIEKLLPDLIFRLTSYAMTRSIDLSWSLSDDLAGFFVAQANQWHTNTDEQPD